VAPRGVLLRELGVPAWHDKGFRGQGVKVAVLDSGFHGYREHLGTALPAQVQVRSFRRDGNLEARSSQHGILCGEVIHAIAPEAQLLFANWEPERSDQFLQAVRWARQQGARVISCSIVMPTWSDCQGHGPIHESLQHLLQATDPQQAALCFASAGNTALRHWGGAFRDGGDGFHVWVQGGEEGPTANLIRPWGNERVSVELCCGGAGGFEIVVRDETGEREVGSMQATSRSGLCNAVVAFYPERGHLYGVQVRRSHPGEAAFHLVVLGGSLRYSSRQGSIPFPGDGPEVIAVGAVDGKGRRYSYSSCGQGQGEMKPDFVASVPFPSQWRARPFTGTSAAAPQAAGLAALLWCRHPSWSDQQVLQGLRTAAHPLAGPTWELGNGRIGLGGVKD
jgi:subtilisin family serine protease